MAYLVETCFSNGVVPETDPEIMRVTQPENNKPVEPTELFGRTCLSWHV